MIGEKEPNGYYWPEGQDNTTPFNGTNLLKVIPNNGCDEKTRLIVGIRSRPSEFSTRNWIRQTWGKIHRESTNVIFVVANHPNDTEINFRVSGESNLYNDILILDYVDHYYNNTLKNYGFFEFVIRHCKKIKCTLKLDGDAIANLPGFEKLCDVSSEHPQISGKVYEKSLVDRNSASKWYAPKYVYDKEYYPPYPYGLAQFITGKGALEKLQHALLTQTPFNVSENYRRLPDDSIYLGEVRELANIPLKHLDGIDFHKISYWSEPSNNSTKIPLAIEVDDREEFWRKFQEFY